MAEYFAIAEYGSLEAAKVGIEVLEKSHFTPDEVSLVTSSRDQAIAGLQTLENDRADMSSHGRGVGLGALLGGAAAAPLAVGTMIGPFFIVGPLLGLAVGAGVGGLFEGAESESLRNLSEDYAQRVQTGSVLIIVAVESRVRLDDAVNPLLTTNPKSLERIDEI